jgi:hypothetical protein
MSLGLFYLGFFGAVLLAGCILEWALKKVSDWSRKGSTSAEP